MRRWHRRDRHISLGAGGGQYRRVHWTSARHRRRGRHRPADRNECRGRSGGRRGAFSAAGTPLGRRRPSARRRFPRLLRERQRTHGRWRDDRDHTRRRQRVGHRADAGCGFRVDRNRRSRTIAWRRRRTTRRATRIPAALCCRPAATLKSPARSSPPPSNRRSRVRAKAMRWSSPPTTLPWCRGASARRCVVSRTICRRLPLAARRHSRTNFLGSGLKAGRRGKAICFVNGPSRPKEFRAKGCQPRLGCRSR